MDEGVGVCQTIEALSAQYPFVQAVWLSRNYGQHAATLAGMASATGDWVVTIDEDGQQDPANIGAMLDCALSASLQLVYAQPITQAEAIRQAADAYSRTRLTPRIRARLRHWLAGNA